MDKGDFSTIVFVKKFLEKKWSGDRKYSQPTEQGHVLTQTGIGQPHQGRVHHRSEINTKMKPQVNQQHNFRLVRQEP